VPVWHGGWPSRTGTWSLSYLGRLPGSVGVGVTPGAPGNRRVILRPLATRPRRAWSQENLFRVSTRACLPARTFPGTPVCEDSARIVAMVRHALAAPWPHWMQLGRGPPRHPSGFSPRTIGQNSSVELTRGKGCSGTGTPKNWQSGSQPSATSKTKSCAGGTAALTSCVRRR
jgi:hypothetical protein